MTQNIYRVGGYYASGAYYTHLVGAGSAREAVNAVKAADKRFVRMDKAKQIDPATL